MVQGHSLLQVKVLSPIMLNPKATQRFVSQDEGETDRMTWADFNGRAIKSAEGPLPAKRVCGAHSHFAIRVGCTFVACNCYPRLSLHGTKACVLCRRMRGDAQVSPRGQRRCLLQLSAARASRTVSFTT